MPSNKRIKTKSLKLREVQFGTLETSQQQKQIIL